jgi:hypothetical protein
MQRNMRSYSVPVKQPVDRSEREHNLGKADVARTHQSVHVSHSSMRNIPLCSPTLGSSTSVNGAPSLRNVHSVCTSYLVQRFTNQMRISHHTYLTPSQAALISAHHCSYSLCCSRDGTLDLTSSVDRLLSEQKSTPHIHMVSGICWAARTRSTAIDMSA